MRLGNALQDVSIWVARPFTTKGALFLVGGGFGRLFFSPVWMEVVEVVAAAAGIKATNSPSTFTTASLRREK